MKRITSIKVYGLVLTLFLLSGNWLLFDLQKEREITLLRAENTALQQGRLIAQGITVIHVAAHHLLNDINGRIHESALLSEGSESIWNYYSPMLASRLSSTPFLQALAVYDYRCEMLSSSTDTHRGERLPQGLCNLVQSQGPSTELQLRHLAASETAHGKPVLAFARNHESSRNTFTGGVVTAINLDYLHSWLKDYALNASESLTIFLQDGAVLAHLPGDTSLGPPASLLRAMNANAPVQPALHPGRDPYTVTSDNRLFGIAKVDKLPVFAVVSFNKSLLLKEWRAHALQVGALTFLLLAVALLGARGYLQLAREREKLQLQAITDPLTGAYNRRHFNQVAHQEIERARRHTHALSLLVIDADHFKSVNDRWGHTVGDHVLRSLTQRIATNLRQTDLVARLGGEEFAVLLPHTDSPAAFDIAQRLKHAVASSAMAFTGEGAVNITISIGLATLEPGETFEHWLSRADTAAYEAKARGRNRVCATGSGTLDIMACRVA